MKQDQASSTAFTVIQGIVHGARRNEVAGLVSPEQVQVYVDLLSRTEEGRRRLHALDRPAFRLFAAFMQRFAVPGITLHYVLRKRCIEDAVVAALDEGFGQVINVGAGMDALAWRLHTRYPAVTFIELDHPATSRLKQAAIGIAGPNLHLVAANLADRTIEAVLGEFAAFRPDQRTIYVCEGVLMYLDEEAVSALFAALRRLSGDTARFVFTAVAPLDSPDNNTTALMRVYLHYRSEPLAWALDKAHLVTYLQHHGYGLIDMADDHELLSRYPHDSYEGPVHRGEYVAIAG